MTEEEVRRIAREEIEETVKRAIKNAEGLSRLGRGSSTAIDSLDIILEAVKERSRP